MTPVALLDSTSADDPPEHAADCSGGQLCDCVRRQRLRIVGESLRLDRLSTEIPDALERLREALHGSAS